MKTWTLLLFILTFGASASEPIQLPANYYQDLQKSVAKKKEALKDIYLKMQASAEYFKVHGDQKELAKALKFYEEIFKFDKNHFIVEMFIPVYQDAKLRAKLMEALTLGLSPEGRKEFLTRLSVAVKEESEGNG